MTHNPDAVRRATARLAWGIALAAVFFIAARPSVAPDTWWHLRTGRWIWEQGAWPKVDLFSYTRYGQPWSPPGPPVQWLMYGLYRLGGLAALDLWTALMVTAALAWVWPVTREPPRAAPLVQALAVVWAGATAAVYWAARPHLVTFLFTAVFLWVLETVRQGRAGPRRLVGLVPLMVVWANAHGGFVTGVLLWAAYAVPALLRAAWHAGGVGLRAAARRWLPVGAGLVVAVLLNPTGPARWLYPFRTVSIQVLRQYIAEWQPPTVSEPSLWPFVAWWFGLVLVLAVSRRGLPGEHLLLWLGLGALAWSAVRHVALFALAAAVVWGPVAADAWARIRAAWRRRFPAGARRPARAHPRLNALLVALLFAAGVARLAQPYVQGTMAARLAATYPVQALAFVQRTRPQARLFNQYGWGGYILWQWPEQRVFVDGRTDLYGDALLTQYLTVWRAEPGWQQVLDTWAVDVVLVAPEARIVSVLPRFGWVEVYRDGHAVVLVRSQPR